MKVRQETAQKIVTDHLELRGMDWDQIREYIDTCVWSGFDCFQLDLMTDYVVRELDSEE